MTRFVWLAAAMAAVLLVGCGGSDSEVQKPSNFAPLPEEGPQTGGLPAPDTPTPPPT